jgi:hypothetical protein
MFSSQTISQQQSIYTRSPSTSETERCAGHLELVAAPLAEYPVPPVFGYQHTAIQYVAVCSALLSQGVTRPAGKT